MLFNSWCIDPVKMYIQYVSQYVLLKQAAEFHHSISLHYMYLLYIILLVKKLE